MLYGISVFTHTRGKGFGANETFFDCEIPEITHIFSSEQTIILSYHLTPSTPPRGRMNKLIILAA